jgi:hypothetical protein
MKKEFLRGTLHFGECNCEVEIIADPEVMRVVVVVAAIRSESSILGIWNYEEIATMIVRRYLSRWPKRKIKWLEYRNPDRLGEDPIITTVEMRWNPFRKKYSSPDWGRLSFQEFSKLRDWNKK